MGMANSDKNITAAKQQFEMGAKYYTGKGVPKDSTEAAKWFRKAADQGEAVTQQALDRLLPK